jgi:hypothetical protein
MANGRNRIFGQDPGGDPVRTAAAINQQAGGNRLNLRTPEESAIDARFGGMENMNVQTQGGGVGIASPAPAPAPAPAASAPPTVGGGPISAPPPGPPQPPPGAEDTLGLIRQAAAQFEQLGGSAPATEGQPVVGPEAFAIRPKGALQRIEQIPDADSSWIEQLAWVLRNGVAGLKGKELPIDEIRQQEMDALDALGKEQAMAVTSAAETMKLLPVIAEALSKAPQGEKEAIAWDWANRLSPIFPGLDPESLVPTFLVAGEQNIDRIKSLFHTVTVAGSPQMMEAAASAVLLGDWETVENYAVEARKLLGSEAELIPMRNILTKEIASVSVGQSQVMAATGEWVQTDSFSPDPPKTVEEQAELEYALARARQRGEEAGTSVKDSDDPTATQAENRGFLDRMIAASGDLDALEKELTVKFRFGEIFGGMAARSFRKENFAVARNAAEEFINVTLRRDSGAAINESEFIRNWEIFIPLPGEGQAMIDTKRKRRLDYMRGALVEAGVTEEYLQDGLRGPEIRLTGSGAADDLFTLPASAYDRF